MHVLLFCLCLYVVCNTTSEPALFSGVARTSNKPLDILVWLKQQKNQVS